MNTRFVLAFVCCLFFVLADAIAQTPPANPVKNPGVEEWGDGQQPTGWNFVGQGGGTLTQDEENPAEGKRSAKLDAASASEGEGLFTNLMQSVDATPFRGKKARYRASVRTADLAEGAKVQLWFRVDRKADASGQAQMGAFDNMQDRPIDSAVWKEFDIVLPVAEDAERLNVGIFVIGRGKAWLDNASVAVADENAKSTEMKMASQGGRTPPPLVMKALREAENAPQQPFFTHWLWLALIAIVLSALAMCGPLPSPLTDEEIDDGVVRNIDPVRKFALRFAVCYWGVYCIDNLAGVIPYVGPVFGWVYNKINSAVVHAMAHAFFGIEGELVPPNGSGDTTYSYLTILAFFVFAMIGAGVWSLLDWRKTDYAISRDLLRSCLRFALALAMLSYGLAKVTLEADGNQFPMVGPYQLDKTWGASSPMGVLWTFMGASRPYTIFAGLGEVAGALLLIWRRTSVLGAMVTFGVMVNVMMLNYCYDVPVKIYSTHLVMMSIMIILPEAMRVMNVFVLNRTAPAIFLSGVWGNAYLAWARAGLKLVVLSYLFFLPLGMQGWAISQRLAAAAKPATTRPAAEGKEPAAPGKKYRLTSRGFRWINEAPFNR